MSQKRNRSINWVEEEKQLFCLVLKEYTHIIENKSLDTNTNKLKTKAWEQVHKKFNELNSRPRELSQLKIQWKTMKVHARKTCSTYKKEINKTGGGSRPATPSNTVIEVKDLLNPAELLIDHNIYDSDGVMIGETEQTTSETCPVKSQDSKQLTSIDNINIENEQMANIWIETIQDVDAQVIQELTPLVISQENITTATPREKNRHSIPGKTSEDEAIMETPMKKSKGIKSAKKVTKQTMLNNIMDSRMKPRKGHEDYVNSMISHSRMLKDEEHMRRMEMAEEEHTIKMEIHKEKLKSAILEREILELKKYSEGL